MKLTLQATEILEKILDRLKKEGKIKNYIITVTLSSRIELKIHVAKEYESLNDMIFNAEEAKNNLQGFILDNYKTVIDIEQISEEIESEDSIALIFEPNNKIHPHRNYNIRRRFHDLLSLQSNTEKNPRTPCPVITFYSYKGGVGRTTILTCYAQYLANSGKNVIIVDCDFEAPGFTNYFGYRFGEETSKNNDIKAKFGLIEYILDRQFLAPQGKDIIKEKLISRLASDYSYQVGEEYLVDGTKGSIRVVKAGNYDTNNIDNYLEGLARLDIGNVDFFQEFLSDLQEAFALKEENSVILIDSRTGFNDTFATLYAISNLVIGVFGTNTQSQTGLKYVLDKFLNIELDSEGNSKPINKEFVFIQSFSANTSNRNELWEIAEQHFLDNPQKFGLDIRNANGTPHKSRFYYFPKSEDIAKIGENTTSKTSEIELYKFVEEDRLATITKLYEFIDTFLETSKIKKIEENKTIEKQNITENSLQVKYTKTTNVNSYSVLLNEIKIPDTRAEKIKQSQKKRDFYLRSGLVDMFNWDKFIISGSKGTGKTFIYECMEIPLFQEALCGEANVPHENYFFVNIIPILETVEEQNRGSFFYTSSLEQYENTSNFYHKFWTVYIANKIFLHKDIKLFAINKNLDTSWCFEFETNQDYVNKLWNIINNDEQYLLVERQLLAFNKLLVKSNKTLIFCLDQLDHFVEPIKWDTWIYELVRLWRANPFSNLLPKIFLRSDLIRSKFIKGVNSSEIFRSSISIEWTKEEIFAYFFGIQLDANPDLLNYFRNEGVDNKILDVINAWLKFSYQIPAKREILEPLVIAFFGASSNRNNPNEKNDYQIPYDWFSYNLRDGNNDLSIRPFILLLEEAKRIALLDENYIQYANESNTILGAKYFADFQSMEYTGAKYYDDLEREQGKDMLRVFREFLRNTRTIKRVGTYELSKFQELLDIFLKNKRGELAVLGMTNIQSITYFLQNNGIIRERRIKGGQFTKYEIPFLYKYYLLFDNA